MKSENIILGVSILAVVAAAVGLFLSYNYVYSSGKVTGWATYQQNATVNLSVESAIAINFTTNNLNFGSGRVNLGETNATIDTSLGTVVRGNWTANNTGFRIENIGNGNVTLNLMATKTAAQFIGGAAGGGPLYQWNITNVESGSCINSTDYNRGLFYNVNTTAASIGRRICEVFGFADAADSVRIDLKIAIPSDSLTGALGDTIIATATSI